MLYTCCTQSQTIRPIHFLSPGDHLPVIKLTGLQSATGHPGFLSALYKNKPLIVAFWGTTCNTCLKSLPILDSLQRQLRNGFNILSVTADNPADVRALFKNNALLQRVHQPYLAGDKLFSRYFSYRYLPHIVWINRRGRVSAITAEEELTLQNLQEFIQQDSINLFQKNDDLRFNANLPYAPADTSIFYRSLLTPFDPGIRAAEFADTKEDSLGNIDSAGRILLVNTLPTNLFYKAFIHSTTAGYFDMVLYNRIIFNIKDSSRYFYPYISAEPKNKNWQKTALYSYELITPALSRKAFYIMMLEELNHCFPVRATIEKRSMPVYLLVKDSASVLLHTSGGPKSFDYSYDTAKKLTTITISNFPLDKLTGLLNQFSINRPVFCAHGLDEPVDISIDLKAKTWFVEYDVASLQQALHRYGLTLQESMQEMEVLVLSDK